MNSLTAVLTRSPISARLTPFALFLVLTAAQPMLGDAGRYWVYLAKTLLGAWTLWAVRHAVPEMRWRISLPALVTGVAMAAVWVGLGDYLARTPLAKMFHGGGSVWNPHVQFGQGSAVTWFFLVVHLAGASLVVPPLEEVFWRSFLYRYIASADFESVPLGALRWKPFLITPLLFALEHQPRDWAAGMLCGLAYQGLVCWKKRLGDAILAHAITNLLLGLWVIWHGAWEYW
jgi:CAAX prenyl protease-like protein